MSGICAGFDLEGQTVDLEGLRTAAMAASRRGPDGIAYWTVGDIGLAYLALRSTPEAAGETQPALSDDRRLCVVAAARLDHREALVESLRAAGTLRAAHPGDAQLILAAYERWVEECPAHLDGDFAFALWDGHKQRLFCARDEHGNRPLHFLRLGTALWVGSDAHQLLALPEAPREIDPLWVAAYLADLPGDPQRTPFHHLRQPPPGWRMIAATTGLDLDRVPRAAVPLRPATATDSLPTAEGGLPTESEVGSDRSESAAGALRELLESSLESCLHTSSPVVGLLLGDDLAGDLLAMAALGRIGRSGRETKLLALLHGRRDLPDGLESLVGPSTEEMATDLAGLFSAEPAPPLDSPLTGWERAATAQLCGLAERGATVLLTSLGCPTGATKSPPSSTVPAWLAPQLLQAEGIEAILSEATDSHEEPPNSSPWVPATTSLRRALEWIERTAAEHGIEVRHPFLDRRLRSRIAALAAEAGASENETACGSRLRDAVHDLLPSAPSERPLALPAPSVPAAAIVVARQRLASEPQVVRLGFCHPARLRRALAGVETASDAERNALWRALTLERWLQTHDLSVAW